MRRVLLCIIIAVLSANLFGFAGGDGTVGNPYQVSNASELNDVRNYLGSYFIQTADIELGVSPWSDGQGWVPIGNSGSKFSGNYNGNGHVINGMRISRSSSDNQGLFGYTQGATVKNVGLTNISVVCSGDSGGIVGKNYGGSIIEYCYSTGSISGYICTGGITGVNEGSTVRYSYSHASAYNNYLYVGSLAGFNFSGSTITGCYSTGSVSGASSVGGLVGSNSGSTVSSSYWDIQTSGQASSGGGTGKTTAEMMQSSTYSGWDFSNVWEQNVAVNGGYPFLRIENVGSFQANVQTVSATEVRDISAQINCNMVSAGYPNAYSYGVCWNTTGSPTTADNKTDEGNADFQGSFSSTVTGLTESTQYYARAYAVNSQGTVYGDQINFVTRLYGGTYSISGNSLDFGSVSTGNSSTLQFTIYNSHTTESLAGEITTDSGYTVAIASKMSSKDAKNVLYYEIEPEGSVVFDLTFQPVEHGDYNRDIVITSSDSANPTAYIAVTGNCIAPQIGLPASLTAGAIPEGSDIRNFDIENTGSADLNYSIAVNYTGGKELKGSGGPDAFGYKWIDSDEPNGPAYNWIEINGVGTRLDISDDGTSGAVGIGFTFNYYGVDYTSIYVGANGALSFTGGSFSSTNPTLPNTSAPNSVVAPFWDDLRTAYGGGSGNIYYYSDTANGRFIVEWDRVYRYGTTTPETFQVIFKQNGIILFQYANMQGTLNSATIGIENPAGNTGCLVAYNSNYVKNNLAVQFSAFVEWLSLDKTSGTVAGPGTDQIAATCSASGLSTGVYTADIIISSNDPAEPLKTIPVTFTVANAPDTPVNVATSITGTDLVVDWDDSANATSYDVYASDDPYGTYSFVTNVSVSQYTVAADQAKMFYYIVAKN